MIVTNNDYDYEGTFMFGRGNIWTPVSAVLGKLFSSAAASTAKETIKQVAKKTAADIGKEAVKQTGAKASKMATEKLRKLLAGKKSTTPKTALQQILQENPSKGSGPSLSGSLTEGLGVKVI